MRILEVKANNRRKAFELLTEKGEYSYPFAKLTTKPTRTDQRTTENRWGRCWPFFGFLDWRLRWWSPPPRPPLPLAENP